MTENEERLRLAMDVACIAAWQWDIAADRMTWSTDPEELFKLPAGSLGPTLKLATRLHPGDGERVRAATKTAIAQGVYDCEYRVIGAGGVTLWITERGRLLRDAQGAANIFVGISRDVTAQRNAEPDRERLLLSEQRAREEAERIGPGQADRRSPGHALAPVRIRRAWTWASSTCPLRWPRRSRT